ncbi:MAG: VOC family protein [Luteolibacter sp.]|uniref:VOC family protein n=1 Tax=Luteolibacter sp. TaxID=1962973 RepID=UPI0032639573
MSSHRGLLHHLIIRVTDARRSAAFYSPVFGYLGYELADSAFDDDYGYQDWKRWDHDTPHEISICQAERSLSDKGHFRGAVGHHDHLAFCAESREDVDRFYAEILVPLEREGLTTVEDPPCDCPEYAEGYYATFFLDPDGLKYEFVLNPNHIKKRRARLPS